MRKSNGQRVFCMNKCLENVDIYRVKLCKKKVIK